MISPQRAIHLTERALTAYSADVVTSAEELELAIRTAAAGGKTKVRVHVVGLTLKNAKKLLHEFSIALIGTNRISISWKPELIHAVSKVVSKSVPKMPLQHQRV